MMDVAIRRRMTGWAKALIGAAVVVAAPVAAAVIASQPAQDQAPAPLSVSVEALTSALALAVTNGQRELAASGAPATEHQAFLVKALEETITTSGATPEVAVDALVAARAQLGASGSLSAEAAAAFDELLTRIRGFLKIDESPASLGNDTSAPPFGAPPTAGDSAGGSDYRPRS
ncbi:hypothetical protein [Caulobacter sp. DWR2-3-1b2]|uniref:hypothetical protein n=1 Tax=unclassified Caulobacter TaxID=2648921 RepID=UPI003CF43ABF